MIDFNKLEKIDPKTAHLKVTEDKGLCLWFMNNTNELLYVGKAMSSKGLKARVIGQHLNPDYIEYRKEKHIKDKDFFQMANPYKKIVNGVVVDKGIDKSSMRKNIGRVFNVKPGIHTVNFINKNMYLKIYFESNPIKVKTIEKELKTEFKPRLNVI